MTYNFTLLNDAGVFDEGDFDTIEKGKEWAKGRGRFYSYFDDEHYKYKVLIMKYVDCHIEGKTLVPVKEYHEE